LYLFESSLEDKKMAKYMIKDYRVPKYFREDILSNVGSEKRPPYRWFLIGPERSGTTVH
jgi:histone arginine demethylase JMJD6